MRSVCIREVQKDLKHSSKQLIEDKIEALGMGNRHGFRVYKDVIETPKYGIVLFQGMQDYTAESIKSLEKFRRAWVEEAQTLSARSLAMLRPTIREPGSELWFSWNPRREIDPVDAMFRKGKPPTGSIVVCTGWQDNPWFPAVLEQERLDCLENDPDDYGHVWGGEYVGVSKGAYYAKQLALVKSEQRIGAVPVDPLLPIHMFCDIGGTGVASDAFAMWAVQFVGPQIRILDYYEALRQDIATHVKWLHEQEYRPNRAQIWLPHDGGTNDRVYDVSYESAFQEAGYQVTVIPNQGRGAAMSRIQAARRLFSSIWFSGKCEDNGGMAALRWYHEKIDRARGIGLGPDHDWSSHGSDAFGLICVAHELPPEEVKPINFDGWR